MGKPGFLFIKTDYQRDIDSGLLEKLDQASMARKPPKPMRCNI